MPKELSDKKNLDEIKKLKKLLKECQKEKEEYLDGWKRAKASSVNEKAYLEKNYKDKEDRLIANCVENILPVLDSLFLATEHSNDDGLKNILSQLSGAITNCGVTEISPGKEKFDPKLHEAIETKIVKDKKDDGMVEKVLRIGYTINNKVIRPAQVIVGKYE